MDSNQANPPDLADYVRPVWQRKWLVLFVVLLATSLTYAYSKHRPPQYDSGTLVFYRDPGDPVSGASSPTTDRTVQDLAGLLYGQSVAAAVALRIHFPGSPAQLLSQVAISARPGQDFIAINGTAGDPRLATAIANGYAQQLVTVTNNQQHSRITQAIQVTQQQLARVPKGPPGAGARQTLTTQLGRLQLGLRVPAANTQQVSPAAPPSGPTSPNPLRDGIFAFVLSLVLAISVAFALERFDRRLKKPDDFEREYGLPLLTVLPHASDPSPHPDGVVELGPAFREAFSLLKTNIKLLTLDAPPKTIVVISAIPGEGKSTVVRNLAVTLCESGMRVAVIEADLRRPTQSGLFGLPPGAGLTEVLTDSATIGEVLHHVPARAPGIETLAQMGGMPASGPSGNGHAPKCPEGGTISVLLSGTHRANPATVLESARAVELFEELSASHDVLIFDSAPMLSVTDSVPLVRYADLAVIVGRLGLTTRDSVRRMTEFLERISDARAVGVVANDLTYLEAGRSGYAYGYGYGYTTGPARRATDDAEQPPKTRRGKRAKSAEHV